MQYDDMILFNLPNQDGTSLGESGRLALVKNLLAVYFKSLKNEHGSCDLSLYEGTQLLKLENFKLIARTIDGNPGTRLMLTKDDVKNPSWKMLCPNENGIFNVAKSGNYFFIFADVHENVTISTTTTHFSQFLFSFH